MSKSVVERYEEVLTKDPSSPVFVELAKVFIERGEHQRAIEVCQKGIGHHPKSVVGRVLWGKALINMGKPAEAMSQFDHAVTIDKANPQAYNLIGEVLLHKGLYRSALPILRKAAQLQPNDGRIRQWLEQTRAVLAGGPAPVLTDFTAVDAPALSGDAEPTVVVQAYSPPSPAASPKPASDDSTEPWPTQGHTPLYGTAAAEMPLLNASLDQPPAASDPFARVPVRGEPLDTMRGMTETFDQLALQARLSGNAVQSEPGEPPPPPDENEPSVIPSQELLAPPKVAGLLSEVESVESPFPSHEPAMHEDPPRSPLGYSAPAPGGLLDEIPELEEPQPGFAPRIESTMQAEKVAREYEHELRQKLAAKVAHKTFLQRHGMRLALISAVVVVVSGLGGSFYLARSKTSERNQAIAAARAALNADTFEQYQGALANLAKATKLDATSLEIAALNAYAHALLFAEHTGSAADKAEALASLQKAGVREQYPELALVSAQLLAPGEEAAEKAVLTSALDKAEVHAEAGRLLIAARKYDEAFKQLSRAVELAPGNMRALSSLGEYYLQFEDWENAYRVLSGASALSAYHVGRVVGLAQARIELGRELTDALDEVEQLPKHSTVPPKWVARRELVLGRLLALAGRQEQAVKTLDAVAAMLKDSSFATEMQLGVAFRTAGEMEKAQHRFEEALKKDPKSEEAKEGLGRVLLARSRERELLADRRLSSGRRVALVRGIAYSRLGDWKGARAELGKTQVEGKIPAEAAVYLALADANEEGGENAVARLEKLAQSTKRYKATVQIALARVYTQKGALDKARAELEQASKDSADYEANALLGEMLVGLGLQEMALEPLARAVERNGSHAPARHLYGQTLLALGRFAEGLKQAESWVQDNAGSDDAQADLSFALFIAGRLKEAERASAKAVKSGSPSADAFRFRAQIQYALGDTKSGLKSLQAANKLNSKDAETFCEIGHAFVRQGLPEPAQKAYEAALGNDPKSVCGAVGPMHARASGSKQSLKALGELFKAARSVWDKALIASAQARGLLAQGSLKEARKAADDALALWPASAPAHYASGLVAQKQKDDAKALEAFGRAVELDAAWSSAHLALADVLARGEDESVKKALDQYDAFLDLSDNEGDIGRVKKLLPNLKKRLSK